MKDTILTARRKKTELITLLVCFILANLANLYAIIAYNTQYVELFTSLGYVAAATLVLYVGWSILRILFYAIKSLLHARSTHI